ncbi:hypothetical protein J6590_006229 [Homalodisca vitripennis]|nr:hypothetical protein J6590_006229 [Homalodisca vitripennis]
MPQLPSPIGQMGQYPGAQKGRFAVSPDVSSNYSYTSNSAGTAAVVREGVRRAQRAQYVRRSAELSKRRRGSARRGASAVCAMLYGTFICRSRCSSFSVATRCDTRCRKPCRRQ